MRALTGAELVSALAKVGKTYKPLVSFIAETGARVSEALRVRYGDVDLRAGTWTVAGRLADNGTIRDAKTPGRMATVPLSKAAVELVKERRRKAMSCDGDRSNAAATLDVYARPPRQGDAARAERKALDA